MGRGYVIEHCVSTLKSINQREAYKIYITDVLKVIAKAVGVEVAVRYADVVQAIKDPQIKEERSAEDIVNSIKLKAERLNNGFNGTKSEDNA